MKKDKVISKVDWPNCGIIKGNTYKVLEKDDHCVTVRDDRGGRYQLGYDEFTVAPPKRKISKEVLLDKVGKLMADITTLRTEVQMLNSIVTASAHAFSRSGYQPIVDETFIVSSPPKER